MQASVQTAGHHSSGGRCPAAGLCHGSGFQAEIPPWLCSLGCKDKAQFRGFGKSWEQRQFPALPEMCRWRIWPLQSHPGLVEVQKGKRSSSDFLLGSPGCSWILDPALPCLPQRTLGPPRAKNLQFYTSKMLLLLR